LSRAAGDTTALGSFSGFSSPCNLYPPKQFLKPPYDSLGLVLGEALQIRVDFGYPKITMGHKFHLKGLHSTSISFDVEAVFFLRRSAPNLPCHRL